ncbi:hypothetical protein HII36_29850 [Nonomuraea sp. NN258]|uniref:hypothetical protein n=1 Tax=Nonomuraea antri TaxID=2730852 RepID=UPI001569265D|nr:hypothetical protein [Nonomuraea antri]NRQ36005.1 hypothetical protein [Nonomuraea antri]
MVIAPLVQRLARRIIELRCWTYEIKWPQPGVLTAEFRTSPLVPTWLVLKLALALMRREEETNRFRLTLLTVAKARVDRRPVDWHVTWQVRR